jgi:hypothetical protein
MTPVRFSIRNLLAAVLVLGLALAALQWNSPFVASAAYTLMLAALAMGLTGALCRPYPLRAFWIGFTVFGWFYAQAAFPRTGASHASGAGFAALLVPQTSSQNSQAEAPLLVTEVLFDFASTNSHFGVGNRVMAQWRGGSFYEATIAQTKNGQYLAAWTDGSTPSWVQRSQVRPSNVSGRQAAHCVMSIFLAFLGGVLAETFFARNSPETSTPHLAAPACRNHLADVPAVV